MDVTSHKDLAVEKEDVAPPAVDVHDHSSEGLGEHIEGAAPGVVVAEVRAMVTGWRLRWLNKRSGSNPECH